VDRTKKDSLTYECKTCRYEQTKNRKEVVKKENPNAGKLKCITCGIFGFQNCFYKTKLNDISSNKEYSEQCKNCYCAENGKSKQCFTCQEIKSESEFYKSETNVDGLRCYCKICRKIKADDIRAERVEKRNENKNQCITCEKYLDFKMFFIKCSEDSDNILYYDECIECYTPNSSQCTTCHEIKTISSFPKDSSRTSGYRNQCKVCRYDKSKK
jgi:hypothetical protein